MFHLPGQITELKKFPMFETYKEEVLEDLIRWRCYHSTYKPGEAVPYTGDKTEFILFLTEGTIETITSVKDGQKVLREQFHGPKLVAPTLPFASDDTKTTVYITALTVAKIWEIHRDALISFVCTRHPPTLRKYLKELSDRTQFVAEMLLTPLDKKLIDSSDVNMPEKE